MTQRMVICELCQKHVVDDVWVCYSCDSQQPLCANCTLRHHRNHEIYEWNDEEPELNVDDQDNLDSVSSCQPRKAPESQPQGPPKVILVGGQPLGDSVQHYNPENANDNSVFESHLPNSFTGHVLAKVADKIIIAGGYNAERTQRVQICDLDLRNWCKGPKMDAARAFGVGLAVDQDFYMFGGAKRKTSSEFLKYGSNSWTPLPDSEIAFSGASIGYMDGKVYILGGSQLDGREIHNVVSMFDIRRGGWAEEQQMRCSRVGAGAANYEDCIIVSGGRSDEGKDMISCELLDKRQRWITIAPMHCPRYKHQLVKCGTHLLAIGGERLNSVEEYDCKINRWTVLEPLLHPCWDTAVFVT